MVCPLIYQEMSQPHLIVWKRNAVVGSSVEEHLLGHFPVLTFSFLQLFDFLPLSMREPLYKHPWPWDTAVCMA